MTKNVRKSSFVMIVWGVFGVLLSGCAEMTEPDVRAYIHEKHAYAEIRHGRLDQAQKDLKSALRDNPREPSILNNMAYIAFRKGQTMKAVGYLEQARVLKTDDNDEPYILNEARIQIAVNHVKIASRKGNLLNSVVEGVPGTHRRRIFHDISHLEIKHERFHMLSDQDEHSFVICPVSQLVGPVILGIQILVLAGRHPEVERQGNRR